jgi:monoamine oxidase
MGMFVFGDVAQRFLSLSDDDIIQTALADIDSVFGNNISSNTFIKGYVQNWVNEPFIRGAYTVYEDNCEAIDILREPLAGVLFFAGEAIPIVESDYANGFVHGAALSGRNAALLTLGEKKQSTGTSGQTPTKSPTEQSSSASNPCQCLLCSVILGIAAIIYVQN